MSANKRWRRHKMWDVILDTGFGLDLPFTVAVHGGVP